MNLVVRRRLVSSAVLASSALVSTMLNAPSSNAATGGLTISPTGYRNSESAAALTFTGTDADFRFGGTATFSRDGGSQPFDVTLNSDTLPVAANPKQTATEDFTDEGDGVGKDGPADAGVYDVTATGANDPTGMTVIGGGGTDTCSSCFTVLAAGPVAVSAISPSSLRPGNAGTNVKIAGDNFERGTTIQFLFADGSVDAGITADTAPVDSNGAAILDKITTRKELQRTAKVDANDTPGQRGIRVTNLDGTTASCTNCFTVAGPALTSISPTSGVNDPGHAPVTVTMNGPNVVNGMPRLEFTGNPGSATRDALSMDATSHTPSTGTSITGDFDLQNAAPGTYQAVVRDTSTGVVNACESPCAAFTVVQSNEPPTVTGLDRDTNASGNQKDQPAGTTRVFNVAGTNFSKGVLIKTTAAKVTVTSVEFVSPTLVKATLVTAKDATTGDSDVTATLTDGSASAACKACYTVTAASSSPSPTASATASASPTGGSPCPTASASSSTSPSGAANCPALMVSVRPTDIVPTEASTVAVRGAPNTDIELYAYSRPNTTYRKVRSGRTDASGNVSWDVTPGGNTRLYAHYTGGGGTTASNDSPSVVITVHTSLSLSAYRDGPRQYHFQGTNLPRRAGQLITLYRYATAQNRYCVPTPEDDVNTKDDAGCKAVRTATAKTDSSNKWRIDRTFTGSGQFYFVVRTSKTNDNGRGHSNQRKTVIY